MLDGIKVLCADDSEDERWLLRRALERTGRLKLVHEAEDGDQTLAYLSGQGSFADRSRHPFPDLLLLDLKMPRCNGFEVLRWLQTQDFPALRVVVLTNSMDRNDIERALHLGADLFQHKPAGFQALVDLLTSLERSNLLFDAHG